MQREGGNLKEVLFILKQILCRLIRQLILSRFTMFNGERALEL